MKLSCPLVRAASVALALALGATAAAALAASPTAPPYEPPPYVAATPDPSVATFDDASVHFAAPSGWKRVDLTADANNPQSPQVAFVENKPYDGATIGITISPNGTGLDRFDADHEQSIRSASGYIEKRSKEKLANGMPAFFIQSSAGDGTDATRRFEWLVVDGQRNVLVTEVARRGVLDLETARKTLSTLSVVVYPGAPPPD